MKVFLATITLTIITLVVGWLLIFQTCYSPLARCSKPLQEAALLDLKVLESLVVKYEAEKNELPSGLTSLVPEYLSKVPFDPWGHRYRYKVEKGEAYIFTYNPDDRNKLIYVSLKRNI